MKIKQILAMSLLVLGVTPLVHADADDCEMPTANRLVVLALHDSLQTANFSDCRIEITDHGLSMDHGLLHGWVNFFKTRTEVIPGKNNVVILGYKLSDDGIAWYQDKFTFNLSDNKKNIVSVDYVQSFIQEVNSGTITQPVYKPQKSEVNRVLCETY